MLSDLLMVEFLAPNRWVKERVGSEVICRPQVASGGLHSTASLVTGGARWVPQGSQLQERALAGCSVTGPEQDCATVMAVYV